MRISVWLTDREWKSYFVIWLLVARITQKAMGSSPDGENKFYLGNGATLAKVG